MYKKFSVVDLFCGVGGLTHGFKKEGFNIAAGIDFDLSCKYAFEKNNHSPFIHADIKTYSANDIKNILPEKKDLILVGCAPCQPFSILGNKSKSSQQKDDESDEKWVLLNSFERLITELRPKIISMENVPLLKDYNKGKLFNKFIERLRKTGYEIDYRICDAQDYGVPQRRKRLVLLGSLLGEIQMIEPTHKLKKVTVRDTIGELPSLRAGDTAVSDPLHRARRLSELSLKRILATPEGGGWKDWNEDLIADCHKKEGGKAYGSAYGRMSWDKVAPTLTTYCTGYNNGRFGHPDQNRPISLREAALIQSFPKKYDFIDPSSQFSIARLSRHIGNAVPVKLGQAIAQSIKVHLENHKA